MREGGKRAGIPDDVVENQIEDAASIVWAKENDSGVYILGNEAGSGKTFVLGSAAKTFLDQGENVLWVTKNHDLIRQAKDDLREFGVGGINFATYNEIRKKGYSPPDNPVLIFDESQSIKNLKSQSGKAGERLISNAKFTVMSSATPFDNPVDAEYLEATGVFDSVGGWKRWAIMYGASVREYKNREQEIVQVPYWPRDTNDQRVRDQQAANDWLKKQGIFIRRPKKLNPELVSAQFRKVTVAQKWVEMSRKLNIVYAKAAKELKNYDGSPASGIAHGLISAHWINLRKRMLEAAKVDALSQVAHEKMAAGEQFVVFVDTKALRSIGRFRKTGDTKGKLYTFPEMDSIMNGWIQKNRDRYGNINPFVKPPFHPAIFHIAKSMHEHGLDMELPSMLEDFENKIGKEHLAYYTGAQTEAEALRNKQEWLDGNKPGLIATMAKGGAGISLHPTTEGNPRSQLNTNLPWSPSMVEQVTGRLARYGVRSPVSIDWFFAENIPFERSLAVRVGGKMRDAGALVRGIDLPAAKALHDWDFEDGNTAMSLVMAEQEKMEAKSAQDEIDEMYRRAEALERNRKEGKSRGTDTTGDYFATPYPLSVLMQRLSGVEKGDRVLEPSAGTGNLLEFMPEGVNITAVEKFRHKGLEEQAKKHKSITTISSDFLDLYKDGKEAFDTIVMNPPFSRIAGRGYQDMTHIQKAETLLSPHGRMVAVLSEGAFFRADRQATEFRQWLEDVGAMVVKLPPDAFVASGTKVRARMIVVDGAASRRHGMTDSLNMGEDMKYQSVEDFIPPRQRYVGARPGFAINPMPEIRALIRYIRDQMRRLLRKMRWDRKWASLKKPPAYVMDADMPMSAENIEILVEAINKAKIPRHLQDMILHKRRQQIAARIHGIIENKTGVERAEAARKAMGGEMPKVGFDPLVDELPEGFPEMIADHVMSHQSFRHQPITKASVAETMRKILHDGYLPTLGELDLIEKFFGPRVAMSLFKKLGAAARFTDIFSKTWHSFTTILSSFDIGFARQAFTIFAAHPTTIPGAYQQLFRAVFSEKNAVEMQRQMKRELDIIDAGAVSGVELTMLPGTGPAHGGKMGGNIAETEETLHSSYVEYLKQLELHGPGVLLWPVKLFGMAIRASERAHVIPLNYLRLRLYRENAELLDAVGYTANTDAGARAHRDLAKVVNVSAGRATGKMLKHQLWGILMYAPRFAFSMIQGLFWTYPKNMVLGPKPLRIEAGRLMFSQIGALIALHWFIKAVAASFDMDIDVDLDPASSDFMRLRVGDNLYGPPKFAQDLRIVYLFFFGVEERVERKMFPNTPGSVRKYGRVPAWDVAKRFFKNKAHPGVQAITAVREGETFSKKGLTFSNFLAGLISPLAMEAIAEGYMRDGIKGGAAAFPEFFGINYYQREFDPEKDNNTYRYDKLADYLHRGNDRMAVMVFKNIVENGGKARRVRAALERRGIGDLREWEYMLHRME